MPDDRSLCFSGLGPANDTDSTPGRKARALETPTRTASEDPTPEISSFERPSSTAPEADTVGRPGKVRAQPFRWRITPRFGAAPLLVATDLIAFTGAVLLTPGSVAGTTIILGVLIFCLIAAGGFYRSRAHLSVLDDLPALLGRVLIAGMVMTSAEVISGGYPARAAIITTVVFTILALCGRSLAYAGLRHARRCGIANHRTLVVGGGRVAGELTRTMLEHPQYGLHPVGFLDPKPMQCLSRHQIPVPRLGNTADLARVIVEFDIRTVVVAFSSTPERTVVETLRECDRSCCEVFVVPRLYELSVINRDTELLRTLPLVRLRRAAHRTICWKFKRVLDVVLSAVLLVVLLPVLATCALLVYHQTGRNVLFRQERVGLDGRPFMLLKFCTLRPTDDTEASIKWSIAHDSRIGPVGRLLRRTSLDELPQLWNILRGDMSLVGPRPERPFFVGKFSRQHPRYFARHRVPSGLTGLAQVNGLCGDTSISDRANFDNFYIENWSLWEDCKILLRTVGHVFRWAQR
ncbi:MAG: sugar transferase [Pseudonocardiales bacterium]|nr:MAG: sugar transferase [Pseudonocardiales bacterium]